MNANKNMLDADQESVMSSMISKKIVLEEEVFKTIATMEKARVTRISGSMCVVSINVKMFIDSNKNERKKDIVDSMCNVVGQLKNEIRQNDSIGWIKKDEVLGIMFTDVKPGAENVFQSKLFNIFKCNSIDDNISRLLLNTIKIPTDANDEKIDNDSNLLELFKKKNQYTRLQ